MRCKQLLRNLTLLANTVVYSEKFPALRIDEGNAAGSSQQQRQCVVQRRHACDPLVVHPS
jgi:hypothetical protein